jgi:acetyltransferase-like isoleucine patch superfamily enzyme
MKAIWRRLWPLRLLNTAVSLVRGARLSPTALIEGPMSRVRLAPGTSVGPRTRLAPGPAGKVTTGPGVWLSSDIEIETDTEVHIGARTTIQRRCTVNGSTRIGADCILAPDVFVSSGTHPFRHRPHLPIREQERQVIAAGDPQGLLDRPVWIQDDCWLGVHAVVSPGVTLGKGSVVGANAVVTRDVPPYSVVAGSPARVISQRLAWEPPPTVDLRDESDWIYVLSGKAVRNAQGWLVGVQVDDRSGVQIALQMPTGPARVKICFDATSTSSWTVNGSAVTFTPSSGSIELPVDRRSAAFGAFAVRLQPSGAPSSTSDVVFTAMQVVAPDRHPPEPGDA